MGLSFLPFSRKFIFYMLQPYDALRAPILDKTFYTPKRIYSQNM